MPEKLLSISEVAAYLGLSEEEVKRLVDMGELPAYKIGGTFLRFRKEQIDAVKSEISAIEEKEAEGAAPPVAESTEEPSRMYTDLEKEIKKKEPITRQYDYTLKEKIADFFYFNDFYIASLMIIALLLYLIFKG